MAIKEGLQLGGRAYAWHVEGPKFNPQHPPVKGSQVDGDMKGLRLIRSRRTAVSLN